MTTTESEIELTSFPEHESPSSPLRNLSKTTSLPPAPETPTNVVAAAPVLPNGRAIAVIIQLAGTNFLISFCNGLITIGLPVIASSLDLQPSLLVWPISVFSLTSGSCLLVGGSLADVLGNRPCYIVGSLLMALFVVASGLSRTGIELIMFRAMHGIASGLAVPSSLSIISTSIQSGRPRNIGFACLGLAMPLGFSGGLVLGGVLINTAGWRSGFYLGGAFSFVLTVVGLWTLPKDAEIESSMSTWRRLMKEPDWVGAGIASSSIALFSATLVTLTSDLSNIKHATTITLLILSLLLIPVFIIWVGRQERKGLPALIPNSIWKKKTFTTICIMIMIATASANCMELLSSLFFQEVQGHSALGASIRILPNLILGMMINLLVGIFVDRMRVMYAVLVSTILCASAPLLMALIHPEWPYWYDAFFAQLFTPISADVLFTIGIIIVSDVFPQRTQALAGAVFNTLAQVGTSIGLTVTSVIASSVTNESRFVDKDSAEALMKGYRASFWMLFTVSSAAVVLGGWGLRLLGKVGEKRD